MHSSLWPLQSPGETAFRYALMTQLGIWHGSVLGLTSTSRTILNIYMYILISQGGVFCSNTNWIGKNFCPMSSYVVLWALISTKTHCCIFETLNLLIHLSLPYFNPLLPPQTFSKRCSSKGKSLQKERDSCHQRALGHVFWKGAAIMGFLFQVKHEHTPHKAGEMGWLIASGVEVMRGQPLGRSQPVFI